MFCIAVVDATDLLPAVHRAPRLDFDYESTQTIDD